MTEIKSELILASCNKLNGIILYTFKWTYPRIILAEVNTHRMFSRNTSSSRAIPSKRQRLRVLKDPFIPTSIGSAKKGMQAGEELTGFKRAIATLVWKGARLPAVAAASILDHLGVHKQVSNRLVEPWTWTEQIVSFTDVDNFIALRAHEMAEPHLQELAYQVKAQVEFLKTYPKAGEYFGGRFQFLAPREWHLPLTEINEFGIDIELAKKVSASRCARVSYNMPDTGKRSSLEDNINLFIRLVGSDPKHMSPVEHQAMAWLEDYYGNFHGWKQFRQEIEAGYVV